MRRLDLILVDLFLIAIATVGALVLRDNLNVSEGRLAALGPYLVATLVLAGAVVPALGLNHSVWRFTSLTDCLRILVATLLIVAGAVALGFSFNRLEGVARALPILQGILIVCALIGIRIAMRLRHAARIHPRQSTSASLTAQGQCVLVVGYGKLAELYLGSVSEFAPDRVRVVGVLGRHERHTGRRMHGHPVLGTPQQIAEVMQDLELHGVYVDRIVVCTPIERLSPQAQNAMLEVEKATGIELDFLATRMGLETKDAVGIEANDGKRGGPSSSQVLERTSRTQSSISLAHFDPMPQRPYWRVKRVCDVAAALGLLVALSPLIALVAALVAVDVGLPVTFWQQRPGKGGHPFRLYKFRTMRAAHDERVQRIPDDQRLSVIGIFIRRTRLDELPQLFNILIGEMSVVGPRPLLPADQPETDLARLCVRPGLTGWAQVHGGREISTFDKAALDVWYIKRASLSLDARILLQTGLMLLNGDVRNEGVIQRARLELGMTRTGETAQPPAPTTEPALMQAAKGVAA